MSTLAIGPQLGNEHETAVLRRSLRIHCIDAATGRPVTDAYAVEPKVNQRALSRHPFRVLMDRDVTFRHGLGKKAKSFTIPVRDLRVWDWPDAATSPTQTWTASGEFVQPHPSGEAIATSGSTFQRIGVGKPRRFIRTEHDGVALAKRDLITNRDGVLEVPLSHKDWSNGGTFLLKFRDHVVLLAEGAFAPDALIQLDTLDGSTPSPNGHRALRVQLEGEPTAFTWSATTDGTNGIFASELRLSLPKRSNRLDISAWLVRRVGQASELLSAVSKRTRPKKRELPTNPGILVHFNSGRDMVEVRGNVKAKCTRAYLRKENDYMMRTEMALSILMELFKKESTLGYHYHIGRNGTITVDWPEARQPGHAGASRELDSPTVAARDWLNRYYIGINLLGNNSNPAFYFTPFQHWYLDRLVGNLQRRLDVTSNHILGHDEARREWNKYVLEDNKRILEHNKGVMEHNQRVKKTGTGKTKKLLKKRKTSDKKLDPGPALRGEAGADPPKGVDGMVLLRGRHGRD